MFCSSCSASSPKESMPSSTPSSVTSGRNLFYSWKLQIKNASACVKANSIVVHYKPRQIIYFCMCHVPIAQLNFLHFRYWKMWDGHFYFKLCPRTYNLLSQGLGGQGSINMSASYPEPPAGSLQGGWVRLGNPATFPCLCPSTWTHSWT